MNSVILKLDKLRTEMENDNQLPGMEIIFDEDQKEDDFDGEYFELICNRANYQINDTLEMKVQYIFEDMRPLDSSYYTFYRNGVKLENYFDDLTKEEKEEVDKIFKSFSAKMLKYKEKFDAILDEE